MLHGGVVYCHDFAFIAAHAAFDAGDHFVFDPDIGKGSAHHDIMMPTPRAIGVEVSFANLML